MHKLAQASQLNKLPDVNKKSPIFIAGERWGDYEKDKLFDVRNRKQAKCLLWKFLLSACLLLGLVHCKRGWNRCRIVLQTQPCHIAVWVRCAIRAEIDCMYIQQFGNFWAGIAVSHWYTIVCIDIELLLHLIDIQLNMQILPNYCILRASHFFFVEQVAPILLKFRWEQFEAVGAVWRVQVA